MAADVAATKCAECGGPVGGRAMPCPLCKMSACSNACVDKHAYRELREAGIPDDVIAESIANPDETLKRLDEEIQRREKS